MMKARNFPPGFFLLPVKIFALGALDPTVGWVNFDFMGPLHRAINLIVALTLVAMGGGGFIYFYFIDTAWPRWITVAAGIVGAAGVYWLWEEHVNLGQHSKN